jgi:hypothetical protein
VLEKESQMAVLFYGALGDRKTLNLFGRLAAGTDCPPGINCNFGSAVETMAGWLRHGVVGGKRKKINLQCLIFNNTVNPADELKKNQSRTKIAVRTLRENEYKILATEGDVSGGEIMIYKNHRLPVVDCDNAIFFPPNGSDQIPKNAVQITYDAFILPQLSETGL